MSLIAAKTEKANFRAPEANSRFRVCAPEHLPGGGKRRGEAAGGSEGVVGAARGRWRRGER